MSVTTEQARRFREEAGLPAAWQTEPKPYMPVVELTRRVLKVWQNQHPDEPLKPDSIWQYESWQRAQYDLDRELSIFHIDQCVLGSPELYNTEKEFGYEHRPLKDWLETTEQIYLHQFVRNRNLLARGTCISVVCSAIDEISNRTASTQARISSQISPWYGESLKNSLWEKTGFEINLTEQKFGCALGRLLSYVPKWSNPKETIEDLAEEIEKRAKLRWELIYLDDLTEDMIEAGI